jgi:hypothetical protein
LRHIFAVKTIPHRLTHRFLDRAGFEYYVNFFDYTGLPKGHDRYYQECRKAFTSKKEFWNNIRTAARYLVFSSWEGFLIFVTDPPEAKAPT